MNYPDPADTWCYPDNAGEAAAADNSNNSTGDMFGDYTTDDLFELAWKGGSTFELEQPAISCLRLSPRFKPPASPEMLFRPPSEDEMAAWLYAIVNSDHDSAGPGGTADDRYAPPKELSDMSMATRATSTGKKEKLSTAKDIGTKGTGSDSSKRQKMTAGARSYHGETHKLTEKKRRDKINERLKTLQHLVPGCDKSNQTSTLDHTIQYMKTLQHQVQALSGGPSRPAAAAAYPVVLPQYVPPGPPVTVAPVVVLGSPSMVPFGTVLPLARYPAPIVMTAAAVTPLCPAATAPGLVPAPSRHGHGSSSSKSKGSGLIQKE